MNPTTYPPHQRNPDGAVSLSVTCTLAPDILLSACDFERLAAREDLDLTHTRCCRYFGLPNVPHVKVREGFRNDRGEAFASLPSMALRPRSGFRVEYVDPACPWDCTRNNVRITALPPRVPAPQEGLQ